MNLGVTVSRDLSRVNHASASSAPPASHGRYRLRRFQCSAFVIRLAFRYLRTSAVCICGSRRDTDFCIYVYRNCATWLVMMLAQLPQSSACAGCCAGRHVAWERHRPCPLSSVSAATGRIPAVSLVGQREWACAACLSRWRSALGWSITMGERGPSKPVRGVAPNGGGGSVMLAGRRLLVFRNLLSLSWGLGCILSARGVYGTYGEAYSYHASVDP